MPSLDVAVGQKGNRAKGPKGHRALVEML